MIGEILGISAYILFAFLATHSTSVSSEKFHPEITSRNTRSLQINLFDGDSIIIWIFFAARHVRKLIASALISIGSRAAF